MKKNTRIPIKLTALFLTVAMMPLQGFSQGAQPIISYNYGAKNKERIQKTFKILLITCFIYSFIFRKKGQGSG